MFRSKKQNLMYALPIIIIIIHYIMLKNINFIFIYTYICVCICFLEIYIYMCVYIGDSILIKFIDVACKVFQIFMKFIL